MKQLGLIDFSACEKTFIVDSQTQFSIGIARRDDLWIFRYKELANAGQNLWLNDQLEIPRLSLVWFLSTLKVEFSFNPGQGGLPAEVLHCTKTFDGEKIGVRRTMNCYKESQRGYTLSNYARMCYINPDFCQDIQLPDFLLFDEGLVSALEEMLMKNLD